MIKQFPYYCNYFSQNTENLQYNAFWVDKYKNTKIQKYNMKQAVHSELLGTNVIAYS
jgi:hypothetical protein